MELWVCWEGVAEGRQEAHGPPSLLPRPRCLPRILAWGTGGGDQLPQHRAGPVPGLLLEKLASGPRRLGVWALSRPPGLWTARRGAGGTPCGAHSPREHQAQQGAEEYEDLVEHGRLRAQDGTVEVILRDAGLSGPEPRTRHGAGALLAAHPRAHEQAREGRCTGIPGPTAGHLPSALSSLQTPLASLPGGGAALGAQDWKARALVRMGVRPGGLGSEGTATLGETRVRLPADSSAKGSWPDTQQRVCPWTWSLWPICSRPSSPQPLVSWAQAKLWAELPPQHRGRGQSRSGQRRKGPDARAFRGDRDSTLLLITPASWGTEGWWPAPRQAGGVLGGSAPRPGGRELPGLRSCFPGRAWPASSSGTRG